MVWLIAVLMSFAAVFAILRVMLRAPASAKTAELDLQVYKDQLQSLAGDVDRGVVSSGEAEAAKAEISRRILAADKRASQETRVDVSKVSPVFMGFLAIVLVGGSLGLYSYIGSPSAPDQPLQARLEAAKLARANRPNQAQAEEQVEALPIEADNQYIELIDKLRKTMEVRKDDVEGWKLLAFHEARIGNFRAAWRAKERMIELLGDATLGKDYADLAEYMILSTNGYVSTEAETALATALKRDAKSPRARYYSGLALAQNGRPDVAYRMWIGLLEEGPADAPWVRLIRGQIGTVARAVGINLVDQNAPGPSAEDIEAAGQMSAEDRQSMIRGMVAGLADRLATKGGTPNEWARLIRAYGTLGEMAKASAIWGEAREKFNDNAGAMAVLLEAAQAAEIAN